MDADIRKRLAFGIIGGLVIGFLLSIILGLFAAIIGGIAAAQITKGSRRDAILSGAIIGIVVGLIQAYILIQNSLIINDFSGSSNYNSPTDAAILLVIVFVVSGIVGGFVGQLVFGRKTAQVVAKSPESNIPK